MAKIQGVILDWAGTAVDFGSTSPMSAFKEAFRRQLPIENLATYEKEEIAMEPSEDLADLPEEPVKKKRGRKSNNNNA